MPEAAPLQLAVAEITRPSARVLQVELRAADGNDLPGFSAGAHIDLELGNGLARSYSLLNNQEEHHRYVIAVLREDAGRGGSAWMHDALQHGAILGSSAPLNNFPLNEAGAQHILIGGGIGITPILSMAVRLVALGAPQSVYYCTRSPQDAPFAEALTTLLGPRAVLHHDGGELARALDVAALLGQRPAGAHVYVCGPRGLIQAVREATQHWPKGTVHFEMFAGNPEDTAPRSTDQPFEIELAQSGQILLVPVGRSILDVVRAAGFKVKTVCKDGVCGTCKTRLLSGVADHRDEVLSDAERARFIQVCVSRAMPGERLVLDL